MLLFVFEMFLAIKNIEGQKDCPLSLINYLLFQYPLHWNPSDVVRMIPGERPLGIDFPVIINPCHVPGMDDLAVSKADAAVPQLTGPSGP